MCNGCASLAELVLRFIACFILLVIALLSMRLDSELLLGVLQYAAITSFYLDLRRRGLEISALRYEDMVSRPLDTCRVVLEFCHLPVSLAELAVRAVDADSQRNSVLARSVVGRFTPPPPLTPGKRTRANELLEHYEMPPLDEPHTVEGTLHGPPAED